MFLTDAQLLSDLSDELKKVASALPNYWTNLVKQSHAWAYGYMVSHLLARGFTVALINQWDYGADYERNLTLWKVLTRAGAVEGYDDKMIQLLDVRKELCDISLSVGGVWKSPDNIPGPGTVGTGRIGGNDDDIFTWPPDGGEAPPGPGLGELTRW